MKKPLTLALMLIAAAFSLAAEGAYTFRNVAAEKVVRYSTGDWLNVLENTTLFYFSPKFIPIVRLEGTSADDLSKTLVQGGFVFDAGGGLYSETVAGITVDQEGEIGSDCRFEVTNEGERVILSTRLRGGYDTVEDVVFLLPDITFRYQFIPRYAAKLRYFFGWYDDGGTSHSLLLENVATFANGWWASVSATGIIEDLGAERNDPVYRWSAGATLHPHFGENMGLTYSLFYESLDHDVWCVSNTLALDIKF